MGDVQFLGTADLPKGEVVVSTEIRSLNDFVRVRSFFDNGIWVFRGQSNAEWSLKSSIERLSETRKRRISFEEECNAISWFKQEARGLIDADLIPVDCLATMQHYGASTRLLDFSRSLFVALHFAVCDWERCTDAAIWAVNLNEVIDKSSPIRDDAEKEAAEHSTTIEEHELIKDGLMAMVSSDYQELCQKTKILANYRFNHKTSDKGVLPVELPSNNHRIIAQNGLFLMPLTLDGFESNLASCLGVESISPKKISVKKFCNERDVIIVKLVLKDEFRMAAKSLLYDANISVRTVYPDISGIAKSVRYE